MIGSAVVPILVFSGIATALAGLAPLCAPRMLLRLAFDVPDPRNPTLFFVRHWGALLFCIGVLIASSAYVPQARTPLLALAAFEKLLIVVLVFFGPLQRTLAMTAIAVADGIFAALYIAYLAGS
jgi:hypothetical protein